MNNTANYANCIIEIVKNSRSNHARTAKKGMILYTVYNYANSWGTDKLIAIDSTGAEFTTTLKSVKFLDEETSIDAHKFSQQESLVNWVEKTHIPIVFNPMVKSRNSTSYKSKIMYSKLLKNQDVWLTSKLIRNAKGVTCESLKLNIYQTAFIPVWYANKIGLIQSPKNSY
tara:strand:- start:165 stop:677 length:513 start_codon:yes stop_codon:yes gene_type:complete